MRERDREERAAASAARRARAAPIRRRAKTGAEQQEQERQRGEHVTDADVQVAGGREHERGASRAGPRSRASSIARRGALRRQRRRGEREQERASRAGASRRARRGCSTTSRARTSVRAGSCRTRRAPASPSRASKPSTYSRGSGTGQPARQRGLERARELRAQRRARRAAANEPWNATLALTTRSAAASERDELGRGARAARRPSGPSARQRCASTRTANAGSSRTRDELDREREPERGARRRRCAASRDAGSAQRSAYAASRTVASAAHVDRREVAVREHVRIRAGTATAIDRRRAQPEDARAPTRTRRAPASSPRRHRRDARADHQREVALAVRVHEAMRRTPTAPTTIGGSTRAARRRSGRARPAPRGGASKQRRVRAVEVGAPLSPCGDARRHVRELVHRRRLDVRSVQREREVERRGRRRQRVTPGVSRLRSSRRGAYHTADPRLATPPRGAAVSAVVQRSARPPGSRRDSPCSRCSARRGLRPGAIQVTQRAPPTRCSSTRTARRTRTASPRWSPRSSAQRGLRFVQHPDARARRGRRRSAPAGAARGRARARCRARARRRRAAAPGARGRCFPDAEPRAASSASRRPISRRRAARSRRLLDAQNYPRLARAAPALRGDPGVALRSLLAASADGSTATRRRSRAGESGVDLLDLDPDRRRSARTTSAAALRRDRPSTSSPLQPDREAPFRRPPLSTKQLREPEALPRRASDRVLLIGAPPHVAGCARRERRERRRRAAPGRAAREGRLGARAAARGLAGRPRRALRVRRRSARRGSTSPSSSDEAHAAAFAAAVPALLPGELRRAARDARRSGDASSVAHGLDAARARGWAASRSRASR